MFEVFTAPALFLLLMLIGALCTAGWLRDRRLHKEAEQQEAAHEAEMEKLYHSPRAVDLASSGIYDWRKSGL